MSTRLSRRTLVAGAITATSAAGIAHFAPTSAAPAFFSSPDTPFRRELAWILGIMTGKPTGLDEAQVVKHLAPSLLAQIPAPRFIASMDQASTQLGPVTPIAFVGTPTDASGVLEIQSHAGDHFRLVLVLSPAPESLITIVTIEKANSNSTPIASPVSAEAMPDTPAGKQLTWLLGLLTGAPVQLSDADIASHFDATFLQHVKPAELRTTANQLSVGDGPFVVRSFAAPPTNTSIEAVLSGAKGVDYQIAIEVNSASPALITSLLISPAPVTAAYASWNAFWADWQGFAQHASFVVTEVSEQNHKLIVGFNETMPLAISSAFKLYVLGSLAIGIDAGVLSWHDQLAIQVALKSLPSGTMQDEPAGKTFTLRQFAEKMISISDNTAADHLLMRLGRSNVEAASGYMGLTNPVLNLPFLTTRELFALKLSADQATAKQYIDAHGYERVSLLPAINALAMDISMASGWTKPRFLEQIEWFASVNDLSNAMNWLMARGQETPLAPILDILSINRGLALDAKTWSYVAFKGGSEPGALTLTWALHAANGRRFIVSAGLNDTVKAIDEQAAVDSLAKVINYLATTV